MRVNTCSENEWRKLDTWLRRMLVSLPVVLSNGWVRCRWGWNGWTTEFLWINIQTLFRNLEGWRFTSRDCVHTETGCPLLGLVYVGVRQSHCCFQGNMRYSLISLKHSATKNLEFDIAITAISIGGAPRRPPTLNPSHQYHLAWFFIVNSRGFFWVQATRLYEPT